VDALDAPVRFETAAECVRFERESAMDSKARASS
jgi:hypothetical protein